MTAENPAWAKLGEEPGQCLSCRYANVNETRRGTAYLRCGRSAWDARLVRYPRLPVTDCVGFEAPTSGPGGTNHGTSGQKLLTPPAPRRPAAAGHAQPRQAGQGEDWTILLREAAWWLGRLTDG